MGTFMSNKRWHILDSEINDSSSEASSGASSEDEEEEEEDEDEELPFPSPCDAPSTPFFAGKCSYPLNSSHFELDSVQFENPSGLTKKPEVWAPLASALLGSLRELWQVQLGCELGAVARGDLI